MKNIKIFLIVSMIILPLSGQAQIFKKMKQSAERAVERTVLNRTERESAKATDKGIDEVLQGNNKKNKNQKESVSKNSSNSQNQDNTANTETNQGLQNQLGSLLGGQTKEIANVPEAYTFSYRAKMKITTGNNEEMLMDYYLEPNVSYFGAGFKEQGANSMSVMDIEQKMMVIFMEQNGQNILMAHKFDPRDIEKFESAYEETDKEYMANMKEISGKNILGYYCKGYETRTKEGRYRIWITDETPVGFVGAGMTDGLDLPQSILRMGKNAMVMEMQFEPDQDKNGRMHMLCVDFEKENKIIKKDDYKSLGF